MNYLDQVDEEDLELDISGALEEDVPRNKRDASHKSLVRVADVVKTWKTQSVATNVTRTADVRSDQPLVFYVWREQTGSDVTLMQMLPSRRSPTNTREQCHLQGHGGHLLTLQQRDDVTELLFKHKVHRKRQVELQVLCDAACADCEPFEVTLVVNIL